MDDTGADRGAGGGSAESRRRHQDQWRVVSVDAVTVGECLSPGLERDRDDNGLRRRAEAHALARLRGYTSSHDLTSGMSPTTSSGPRHHLTASTDHVEELAPSPAATLVAAVDVDFDRRRSSPDRRWRAVDWDGILTRSAAGAVTDEKRRRRERMNAELAGVPAAAGLGLVVRAGHGSIESCWTNPERTGPVIVCREL